MAEDDVLPGATLATVARRLTLSRAGPRGALGWPVMIEAEAGPFSARLARCTLPAIEPFAEALAAMDRDLKGHARLEVGGLQLLVVMQDYGRAYAAVDLVDVGWDEARLRFNLPLDQTYLAPFVAALRREFPELRLVR